MSKKKGWRYPRGHKRRELAAYLLHVLNLDPINVEILLGHFKTVLHSIETKKYIATHYLTGEAQEVEMNQLGNLEEAVKKMQENEIYFKEQVDYYLDMMNNANFSLPPIQRSEGSAE